MSIQASQYKSTKARTRAKRLRGSRGAAYAETVVMLPFFIAVWTCMIYVHKAYSTKIYTMSETRNCVWSYAYDACQNAPSGCNVTRGPGSDAGESPGALSSLASTIGPIGTTLLGAVFGENANSRMTRPVRRPPLLGGGSTTALAGASMMCNTQRQELADIARTAFCSLTIIPC